MLQYSNGKSSTDKTQPQPLKLLRADGILLRALWNSKNGCLVITFSARHNFCGQNNKS